MMMPPAELSADPVLGMVSESAHASSSDTSRLVLTELAGEPDQNASRDIEWRAGEVLLDEFEVERLLGAGGFGSVTLVKSALTDRRYAMKTIKPELIAQPSSRRAFGVELAMWIELGAHPHVVRASFVRQIGATVAVFMEYLAGGTLAEWIARGLLVEREAIARVAGEIAAGLGFAHARGLVHADVKPANVLVSLDGAKVSDFGLAVATGNRAGGMTITYRSPEQADGRSLTVASDVWSFGLTVLAMFAGGPFWADGLLADAALQDFIDEPFPGRPPLPEPVSAALRRCFAPRPEERWSSVTAAACAMFGSAPVPVEALKAPAPPAEPPKEPEKERPIERWLLLAMELTGRDASDARAQFPPRRASAAAQAAADLDAFEFVAPLLAERASPERLAKLYRDWAYALQSIGDWKAAMERAEMSVAALKSAGPPDPFVLAPALCDLAFVAMQCRRHMEAGPMLDEAIRALGVYGDTGDATTMGPATILVPELGRPLLRELGRTYTATAQWARLWLQFEGARACGLLAVKACSLAVSTGPADASLLRDLGRAHLELATAQKWLNRSAEAVESFETAFEVLAASGDVETVSEHRVFYSNALRDAGRLDEAMAQVELAVAELEGRGSEPSDSLNGAYHADTLNMAYHARAALRMRRDDWRGALTDFERVRRHFERLVYDHGQRGMYRFLAQAEIDHASALEGVGRPEEALGTLEHAISLLQRLRRLGEWGPLSRELSEAHRLATICEFSLVIRGVETHGSFPLTRSHRTAMHADLAAMHADAHYHEKQSREAALRAARLASTAAGLLESEGERDLARDNRVRALDSLDSLEATPGGASEEGEALRRELEEQGCEADLSFALVALLKGDGEGAITSASPWGHTWLSKCIQICARLYFLYEDPPKAAEAFGGLEAMRQMARQDRVDLHFLRGMGALFRGNQGAALASLRAAAKLAPSDRFVLFGLAYVCSRCGAGDREAAAARDRLLKHAGFHPLTYHARVMLGRLERVEQEEAPSAL